MNHSAEQYTCVRVQPRTAQAALHMAIMDCAWQNALKGKTMSREQLRFFIIFRF